MRVAIWLTVAAAMCAAFLVMPTSTVWGQEPAAAPPAAAAPAALRLLQAAAVRHDHHVPAPEARDPGGWGGRHGARQTDPQLSGRRPGQTAAFD